MSKIYRHYGDNKFDIEKFNNIKNKGRFTCKPLGGLWASPIECEYGWKDFVENDYTEKEKDLNRYFDFNLDDNSKIIIIDSIDSFYKVPLKEGMDEILEKEYNKYINNPHIDYNIYMPKTICIDFEKCLELGIDGIEVEMNSYTYYALYGWDCDSIVILNPKIIKSLG